MTHLAVSDDLLEDAGEGPALTDAPPPVHGGSWAKTESGKHPTLYIASQDTETTPLPK